MNIDSSSSNSSENRKLSEIELSAKANILNELNKQGNGTSKLW